MGAEEIGHNQRTGRKGDQRTKRPKARDSFDRTMAGQNHTKCQPRWRPQQKDARNAESLERMDPSPWPSPLGGEREFPRCASSKSSRRTPAF